MLTVVVAHVGRPMAPHDLWSSWNLDALVLSGLLLLALVYWRGRTRTGERWRSWCFAGGLLAIAVALLSPLDPLSGALASAHMVQHLLLVLVAAPLLAVSVPASALLRGGPAVVRRSITPWRRRLRLTGSWSHALRNPALVWLLHVGTLWAWHAGALYDAALASPVVHVLEHASFLVTGVLLWRVVLGPRAVRVSPGLGVLLVFTLTLQSSLLSLLLTFSQGPWYSGYATTTRVWGLEQLADQQLAGVIMWVPAGLLYVGVALTLLVGWVRGTEQPDTVVLSEVPEPQGFSART